MSAIEKIQTLMLHVGRNIKSAILFIWLACLTLGLMWWVIGALSSYQFHETVAKFAQYDTYKSRYSIISRAETYSERDRDIRYRLSSVIYELARTSSSLSDAGVADSFLENYEADYSDAVEDYYASLDELLEGYVGDERISELYEPEDYQLVAQEFSLQQRMPGEDWQQFDLLLTEFFAAQSGFGLGADNYLVENGTTESSDFRRYSQQKIRIEQELEDLKSEYDLLDDEEAQRFIEIAEELTILENTGYAAFAKLSSPILVLVLTIAMGMLGSVIFIVQDFTIQGANKPTSWYFLRPLLGMVTAIAIFVLAKAGQITIADSGSSDDHLNPFFVSFLAIISGLLSEQAIKKIGSSAKSFFNPDAEVPTKRWCVQVASHMQEQGKSVEELAGYLNYPLATIETWIGENESVPEDAQSVIAGWLRMPVRELFSDIQPG